MYDTCINYWAAQMRFSDNDDVRIGVFYFFGWWELLGKRLLLLSSSFILYLQSVIFDFFFLENQSLAILSCQIGT